jgi:hypothetical protein
MIDWDEIDWKRGIATLVLGLLIIAGGLFVLNDYLAFKRTKADLDQNLSDINAYAQKYPPAAGKDSSQVEAQIQALEAQLAASKVKVAESYDEAAVKAEIQARANLQGAKLISVEVLPEEASDFAVSACVKFKLGVAGDYLEFAKVGKHNVEFVFDGETQKLKALRRIKQ